MERQNEPNRAEISPPDSPGRPTVSSGAAAGGKSPTTYSPRPNNGSCPDPDDCRLGRLRRRVEFWINKRHVNIPKEDREDLVQDTVVKLWKSLGSANGAGGTKTWDDLDRMAPTAAAHAIYDWVRNAIRRGAPQSLETLEPHQHPADPQRGHDPEEMLLAHQLRHDLAQALAQLAPGVRTAVHLVDVLGYDKAQVCEILGISRGTLHTRLSRGRQRIREFLEQSRQSQRLEN